MKKLGRPIKDNPIAPGELKSNLCRFTFIVEKSQLEVVRKIVGERKLSIKDYMSEVLNRAIKTHSLAPKKKPFVKNARGVSVKNEERMKKVVKP